jgi:plastocyanin
MRTQIIIVTAAAMMTVNFDVGATSSTIEQTGQHFSEKSVALNKGDAIVFANRDDVTHNITVLDDADASDLGLQKPGRDLVYTFDRPGRFKIRCSIHPSMKMAVDVR